MKIFFVAVCAFYVAVFSPCQWVVADDFTAPRMIYVELAKGESNDQLKVSWDVEELESDMEVYYLTICQIFEETTTKFWPTDEGSFVIAPTITSALGNAMETKKYLVTGLSLKTGAQYFAEMTAMNRFGLLSVMMESTKVLVN